MPRVTITVPSKKPQPYRFQLDRQTIRLGRGSDNDIVVDCPSVSVRHAEMERVPGGYFLRDLGSTNGTKLDDVPKETIELKNGLAVKLGDVEFDFQLAEEELKALAEEAPAVPSPIIMEDEGTPAPQPEPAQEETPKEDPPQRERSGKRRHREPAAADQPSAASSFFTTLLLFALAVAAFVTGLALRHNKETGRSLFGEIFGHKPAVESPATDPKTEDPAPAGQE